MKKGFNHIKIKASSRKGKFVEYLDKIVLIVAVLIPLVEIPQLIEIYTKQSAQNVSSLTWGAFVLFGIPWLIYGIVHKEKPVIVLYALWIVIDSLIFIGTIIY